MIRKYFYIFSVVLLLASCATRKKMDVTSAATPALNTKAALQRDMNLFFDAESARLLGEKQLALKLYTDYLSKNPKNATAWYNTARLLQNQDIGLALKNAEKASDLDPDNKYFQELFTHLLVYDEKFKQAEVQYNSLISKYPENEEYIYKKAMLYMKSKDYDKALQAFLDLEKKMGFNEDIILQKKNIYQRQNKTDLAIQELKRLREADPATPQYAIMMIDVYETGDQKDKIKGVYEDIEKSFPNDPLAQVALAQYYLENKNMVEYNRFMQKVMKNKNLDADTKMALIRPSINKLESDSSDMNEILTMAKSIAEESPGNKDALELYADILYYSKQYDDALQQYQKYLQHDKSKFDVWSQVMSIYLDKKLYDSVIRTSSMSLEYFPNNPIPYYFSGMTYLLQKESEKAIEPFNLALELEPVNARVTAQIYSSLGDVYNTLKNYPFSDSCFNMALKLEPDDAATLNNFAYYLSLRKEKLDEAEKMSKKSLALQPSSKSFLDTYGWILFQQKKYTEAKEYIEKAIRAGGEEDGTLYEHLGDVYFKMNEVPKAIEHWKKAMEKGEDSPLLNKKIKAGTWYEE